MNFTIHEELSTTIIQKNNLQKVKVMVMTIMTMANVCFFVSRPYSYPHRINVFRSILESHCPSVWSSVCLSMCWSVYKNTSFCQNAGGGIKSHLVTALVFSSTGRRPASLCHGLWSVHASVCPCVNFFFKHLLLWNYLSEFDEISQKWKNLIPSKTVVAMATKLKKFWKLWKSSCQKPWGLQLPNLVCSFT